VSTTRVQIQRGERWELDLCIQLDKLISVLFLVRDFSGSNLSCPVRHASWQSITRIIKMSMHPLLLQDYLLEQIFQSIYPSCPKGGPYGHHCSGKQTFTTSGWRFPKKNPKSCSHTDTLASCVLVSRRWSHEAIRTLWSRYANYEELMALVLPRSGDLEGNPVCRQH